jgi:cell division protein FtsB
MDPAVAEVLGPVLALTGMGAMILIGMKMRYTHLRDTKLAKGAGREVEQLADAVDSLRDEVRELREGMVDLHERVEFAERVLTRGRAEGDQGALPAGGG